MGHEGEIKNRIKELAADKNDPSWSFSPNKSAIALRTGKHN